MWMPAWLALGSLCLAAAHVAEAKANGRAAWLPSLRLIFRHSDTAISGGCPKCWTMLMGRARRQPGPTCASVEVCRLQAIYPWMHRTRLLRRCVLQKHITTCSPFLPPCSTYKQCSVVASMQTHTVAAATIRAKAGDCRSNSLQRRGTFSLQARYRFKQLPERKYHHTTTDSHPTAALAPNAHVGTSARRWTLRIASACLIMNNRPALRT